MAKLLLYFFHFLIFNGLQIKDQKNTWLLSLELGRYFVSFLLEIIVQNSDYVWIHTLNQFMKKRSNNCDASFSRKGHLHGHVKSVYEEKKNLDCKVHIFWEGHKILRDLQLTFDCMYCSQKLGEDFAKFCGLLRIYEL